MSYFKFQLKEDGREGRGRTGKSEVKVPDEKCQLEMVYNEDISLISHFRVGELYFRVIGSVSWLQGVECVGRGNVVE